MSGIPRLLGDLPLRRLLSEMLRGWNTPRGRAARHRGGMFDPTVAVEAALEPRRFLAGTVVYPTGAVQSNQLVEVRHDPNLAAQPILITVNGASPHVGNQAAIFHAVSPGSGDRREVFVIDTNGYARGVHVNSNQAPNFQDGLGGSFVLGPTMILDGDIFALTPRVQALDILTPSTPNGPLVLRLSGAPPEVPGLTVVWTLTIPLTTPAQPSGARDLEVSILQEAHFASDVTLSSFHQNVKDGFRVARFSNSHVRQEDTTPATGTTTHDADILQALDANGSQLGEDLELAEATQGNLLIQGGWGGATEIRTLQRSPALLNDDPPNLALRIVDAADPSQLFAQGLISDRTIDPQLDENSDNVDWYIHQDFPSLTIPAGTDLSWTLAFTASEGDETLPQVQFLRDQARQYTHSANPSDLGQPMIPVFTNGGDGGVYLQDVLHGGVTDDAYDPDAYRGRSSYRMSLTQLGANGFAIFKLGTARPPDLPEIGLARKLRFAARGDAHGQLLEVKVIAGSLVDLGPAALVPLTTDWEEYEIALPAGIKASDVDQLHFVLNPNNGNQGNGTVRLDEIRLSTDGSDPLRTLQSYRPLDVGGAPNREVGVYSNYAFLYDNAVAIKMLLAARDPENLALARDVANAFLLTQATGSGITAGSFTDHLASGHVRNSEGVQPSPFAERRLGDNMFFGLALLELAREVPSDPRFYAAAVALSDWMETNLRAGGTLGGYYGGLGAPDPNTGEVAVLLYRSTEHNLDAFEFHRQLAELADQAGDASRAAASRARATHAGAFVAAMFDEDEGKFWTGTNSGADAVNTGSVPADVQFWAQQTLGQSTEFGAAVDYERAVDWAIANLEVADDLPHPDPQRPRTSFSYSTNAKSLNPNIAWLEGTAHAAVSFSLSGAARDEMRTMCLETLRIARLVGAADAGRRHDGYGVPAASADTLIDPLLGAIAFEDRLHLGATAWAYFAARGLSPFQPIARSAAPVVTGIAATAAYTENAAAKALAPQAVVADPDSPMIDAGRLTVTYLAGGQSTDRLTIRNQGAGPGQVGVSGDTISVGGIAVATFVGGTGLQPLVITFNTASKLLRVQAVLRNILYQNVSDNPTHFGANPSRTVNYVLTDGAGGAGAAVNQTLNITAVNDKPVLGGIPSPQTYTENTPPKVLALTGTVADPDSANFAGGRLTVKHAAGGLGSDRLTIRNQGNGPGKVGVSGDTINVGGIAVATFVGGTGLQPLVITFNADSKLLRVQAVLRNILYQNVSDNPTNFGARPSRTVNYVLVDGDGGTSVAVNQTLNITALNDASAVGAFTDPTTYTAGAGPTILDANATVSDADSADFATGSLTLSVSAGGASTNRLAIRNQGTGAAQVSVTGDTVSVGGTPIGTFTGGAGLTALTITFNADATPGRVQALVRNLTFHSVAANPPGPQTLRLVLRDGDGGTRIVNKPLNIASSLTPASTRSSAAFAVSADRSHSRELGEREA